MKKYIALFILSLIVFIVIKAPANLLQDKVPNFILSGKIINGSAWHKDYGTIKWDFLPLQLFTGSLAFEINLSKNKTNITTIASIDILTNKKLRNTNGLVELDYIKKFNKNIPEFVNTNILINSADVDIDELKPQLPPKIKVNLTTKNLVIMGEKLGDYILSLNLEDKNINANLTNDKTAIFTTNITANTKDNNLIIKGNIKGNNTTAKNLLQALNIKNKINYKLNIEKYLK